MLLMGGGAASELQDYLVPPANRATRNYLPRLYSKPDMMKEIWKYLHKPRYVDLEQLNRVGRTAEWVAADADHEGIVALLQGLDSNDDDSDDDSDDSDDDDSDNDGSDDDGSD